MSEVQTTNKSNVFSNTFNVVLAKEGETIATTEARQVLLLACGATAIASSMYTRKRANAGKPPFLKVVF